MNAVKSLLAVTALAVAGAAHASVVPFTATITAQTAPFGTQTVVSGNAFTGTINVDDDLNSPTVGSLLGFSISNTGTFVTNNNYLAGTTATWNAGNVWTATLPSGGLPFSAFDALPDGTFNTVYTWGSTATTNSNAASSFSGHVSATGPGAAFVTDAAAPWDAATLTVHLGSDLATILDVTLVTQEKGSVAGSTGGIASNTYTITPAVPVPAAAWLFGSGLLGLAGTARRRRNSEAA
jgi:hypothetical protein